MEIPKNGLTDTTQTVEDQEETETHMPNPIIQLSN